MPLKILIITLLALLTASTAAAQTAPANGRPPGSSRVAVCHYDANDGRVYLESKAPDEAPVDRGVATQDHDVLAGDNGLCEQAATPEPTSMPTPAPTATPVPTTAPEVVGVQDAPTALPEPVVELMPPPVESTPSPTRQPRVPVQMPGKGE